MADLLVIIPCLNEEAHIEGLAHYLLSESRECPQNDQMRIIIADGGSTDRTTEIARNLASQHPSVTYLHNPKRLQSAAINLAVATYGKDADYFIRLDAHADYPPHYCRTLLEEAKATGADSVVVTMDTRGKTGFQRAVAAAQNSKLGNGGSAHRSAMKEGKWVDHGHHALMRVSIFQSAGGYDESFSHNEDAELDTRLGKAGYKIWLTAKTSLIYYPRSAPIALFRQYFHYGNGRIRNILKHKTRPKLRQLLPVAAFPAAVLALGAPIWHPLALPLLAWALLCAGYGTMLAFKVQDRTIAMSGPAAMLMHTGWSLGFWYGLLAACRKRATS